MKYYYLQLYCQGKPDYLAMKHHFYISFAIYYRMCRVFQIEYLLSFGSKLDLFRKLIVHFNVDIGF